jgi:2-polyprenyl-6-methoxyphenol hydroxylase-like FAD-dependent oxidoreductase
MAEETPADRKPFDILIVGAGIGGLGAAIALSKKGFPVRVLEEKNGLNEFGASINVLSNATKILNAWGLEADFDPVVDLLNWTELRNGTNNESIGKLVSNAGNRADILYGAP